VDTPPAEKKPSRLWRWCRRALLALLLLASLLVVFHRPLLLWAIRFGGAEAAEAQKVALDWRVGGSVLHDLDVRQADASAGAQSWLPKAQVGRLAVSYDLKKLLREGPQDFISSVVLHEVDAEVDLRKLPAPEKAEPKPAAKPGPPKLVWPRAIDIENVNAVVTLGSGKKIIVRGLTLRTGEGMPGIFECSELRIEPGTLALANLKARVSLEHERISISGLRLPFGIELEALDADLSRFGEDRIMASVKAAAGPGRCEARVEAAGIFTPPLLVDARLDGTGFRADELYQLGVPEKTAFDGAAFSLSVKGDPRAPKGLDILLSASLANLRGFGASLDVVKLDASLAKGEMEVTRLQATRGGNDVMATVRATMPGSWSAWQEIVWSAEVKAGIADATQMMDVKLPVKAAINLQAAAEGVGATAKSVKGVLDARSVEFQKARLDAVRAEFALDGKAAKLRLPGVEIGIANTVALDAELQLEDALPAAVSWKAKVSDPALVMDRFGVAPFPEKLASSIETEGSAKLAIKEIMAGDWSRALADARVVLGETRYGDAGMKGASIAARVEKGSVRVIEASVRLDDRNCLSLTGDVALKAPFAFRGVADANLPQLAALNTLAKLGGAPRIESGSLALRFDGEGELKPWRCAGSASVRAENARVAGMPEAASVKSEARMEGANTTFSALSASYGPWRAEAKGSVTGKAADLSDLRFWHRDLLLATGRARAPFDLMNGSAQGEAMDVDIAARDIPLHQVCALAGSKLAPEGAVSATVVMKGRLPDLAGKIGVHARGARMAQTPKQFSAAAVDFEAVIEKGKLAADLRAAQPPLQPLHVTAALPVDWVKLRSDPKSVMASPLDARLEMPETDLGFAAQFAPGVIKTLPAKARMDFRVSGTVGKPVIAGGLDASCGQVVFARPDMPAVRDAIIRLRARDRSIAIEEVSAVLAGGRVKLAGTADLSNPGDPRMDLRIEARDACVFRDPSVSVRANADLTCRGTAKSARVEGLVEAVRGRMFKEVNLMPSVMPSDLPPLPPSADRAKQEIKLPEALKDWSFDVRVRTRDPFRIAGNVAVGAVSADARLAGTGAAPVITGRANIDEMMVRLPFSLVKVEKGVITLDPAQPMNPALDIRAASRVGRHDITLYVYGRASAPKTRFVSMPPLPEPEIATLLATGTSLKGSPSELASEAVSRAVFLTVSEFYRKTFHKEKRVSEEPPRLHMTFQPAGSGRKTDSIQATYDITKKFRFTGRFSQGGGLRGVFDYLLRFGKAARLVEEKENPGEGAGR
jgi:hypothetical protein